MTEKLLTYAPGRGVEYYDMPAVRRIVRDAGTRDFKFSALIEGVVQSTPFQMKVKAPALAAARGAGDMSLEENSSQWERPDRDR